MNLAHALEVMERYGLDGLVLGEPVNVYHLLGYWPQLARTRVGQPPTTFALLTRAAHPVPALVASRFIYYYTYADGGYPADRPVYLYREPGDAAIDDFRDDAGIARNADAMEFPDLHREPLSTTETRRRSALDAATSARRGDVDAGAALVRAMRDLGLWRGRVAYDHPVIAAVCTRHDRPGELVPGDNVLRWIRLVKSPLEIMLLRRAAAANAAAIHELGRYVRAGATHAELQQGFAVEAARRGNQAVFLNVDRVSSELSQERIVDGQVLFIDGVSHFAHYHGDYARTVVVGEPAAAARSATRAVTHAWRAIREQLRPGLRYSQIVRLGQDALRKGGFDVAVGFGPHSVGLMHTDEPGDLAGGFHRKLDLELRENMVLSVDCPVMNTGIGGSAHIEDLMLITANGAEPLHVPGEAVIIA